MWIMLSLIEHRQPVIPECIQYINKLSLANVTIGSHDHEESLRLHTFHERRTASVCPA